MTATDGAGERRSRSPALLLVLGLSAALVFAGLTALGVWQLQRRVWKLDLIAQVDQRVHAAPVDTPGPAAWPAIDAARDGYRRVRAQGVFQGERAAWVQAATALGSGYWLLVPLRTDQGFTVLVNRGFVPDRRTVAGPARAEVTGLLRLTEPGGGFLRSNDPAADRWYSRDVAAIAQARGLTDVAPYFIDADAVPGNAGGPVGGLTVVSFPNNHLVYALTWFALAAMVAGGAAYVAREEWRARRSPAPGDDRQS
ncbi:SURF1 family protein [Labrys wisconsinensis]|uniref:SURF1-like protein n=1 Tax=Labrys wisconsinensis TaxID=425677 RepID=A0ABU0J2W8_9HYPH|nr:SURF1 family protein [Labrys wisconsinensis]MDQ0468603.1 surfeit locus 1 family protein [Labrys wisconsinensis]